MISTTCGDEQEYRFSYYSNSICDIVKKVDIKLGMGPNTQIFENHPNIQIAKSYSII